MSRLLESIRCDDGRLRNLPFHQARMDASLKRLFSMADDIRLEEIVVPPHVRQGLYKCRVVYQRTIESIEFLPYVLPKITTLRLVAEDDIDYSFKFANRAALQVLLDQRGDSDEVLIVKNGLITDTSFTNIIFFDGEKWLTPAQPLLRGTQREYLLSEGRIYPSDIRSPDLPRFHIARLINSMIRFEDECDVAIE